MKRWRGDLEGILFPKKSTDVLLFCICFVTPLVLCAQSRTLEEDNLWHKYSWTDLVLLTQQCIVLLILQKPVIQKSLGNLSSRS